MQSVTFDDENLAVGVAAGIQIERIREFLEAQKADEARALAGEVERLLRGVRQTDPQLARLLNEVAALCPHVQARPVTMSAAVPAPPVVRIAILVGILVVVAGAMIWPSLREWLGVRKMRQAVEACLIEEETLAGHVRAGMRSTQFVEEYRTRVAPAYDKLKHEFFDSGMAYGGDLPASMRGVSHASETWAFVVTDLGGLSGGQQIPISLEAADPHSVAANFSSMLKLADDQVREGRAAFNENN